MGYEVYGVRFPTRRAAQRYKDFLGELARSGLDTETVWRLTRRSIALNGGL